MRRSSVWRAVDRLVHVAADKLLSRETEHLAGCGVDQCDAPNFVQLQDAFGT